MLITGRRIRNPGRYLGPVQRDSRIIIGVTDIGPYGDTLERAGFPVPPQIGDSVLPAPDFGPVSRYNADGKEEVHRDQPMETAYMVREWHWTQWQGPYRIPRSKLVSIPYKRYPRTFIPPPSVELRIAETGDGNRIVASPAIEYVEGNDANLLHTINLFLEIFGECEVLTENLEEITRPPIRRLNWTVLPPGRRPWPQLRGEIRPTLEQAPEEKQRIVEYRLQLMNDFEPEFHAIGNAGFRSYIVFGFPEKNLYVAESVYTGNATYVFDERWEALSRMTKAEILDENLQTDRIVHAENWEYRVRSLLST
jgi:hypothetical protein